MGRHFIGLFIFTTSLLLQFASAQSETLGIVVRTNEDSRSATLVQKSNELLAGAGHQLTSLFTDSDQQPYRAIEMIGSQAALRAIAVFPYRVGYIEAIVGQAGLQPTGSTPQLIVVGAAESAGAFPSIATNQASAGLAMGQVICGLSNSVTQFNSRRIGLVAMRNSDGSVAPHDVVRLEGASSKLAQCGLSQLVDNISVTALNDSSFLNRLQGNEFSALIGATDEVAVEMALVVNRGPANDFIPVVGFGATWRAIDAIESGKMTATFEEDFGAMAEKLTELFMMLVAGQTLPTSTTVDAKLVTRQLH